MFNYHQERYGGYHGDDNTWMGAPGDPSCEWDPNKKSSMGTLPLFLFP
jgi:hypothetical protein